MYVMLCYVFVCVCARKKKSVHGQIYENIKYMDVLADFAALKITSDGMVNYIEELEKD